jgi:hypothetical protein
MQEAEARFRHIDVINPRRQVRDSELAALVGQGFPDLVGWELRTSTVASATSEPVGSFTVPTSVAVGFCAASWQRAAHRSRHAATILVISILDSPAGGSVYQRWCTHDASGGFSQSVFPCQASTVMLACREAEVCTSERARIGESLADLAGGESKLRF